ncbi:MAG: hypothetical protein OER04_15975 [Cyclobacteriaceae bacterium]|nr:hypothetical protein [Cyclobacteriaceae bacterium]
MQLSDQNRKTLLTDLHRIIQEQTHHAIEKIFDSPLEDRSIYPPDVSKTAEEMQILAELPDNPNLRSALEKVFKDNTATVLFRFFSIIDRVGYPDPHSGTWAPITMVDLPEQHEQDIDLHDNFFETYWDWKEKYRDQNHKPVS